MSLVRGGGNITNVLSEGRGQTVCQSVRFVRIVNAARNIKHMVCTDRIVNPYATISLTN